MGHLHFPALVAHQADATISQASPGSTTLYTVLDTTKNVRIISIEANVAWAVTQPTPLEIVITIDGQTIIHAVANPANGTSYTALPTVEAAAASQLLYNVNTDIQKGRTFLYEGRSVKIQARATTTGGTSFLNSRVKYAKIP